MKIAVDLTSLDDNLSGLERYAMNIVRELVLIDQRNQYLLFFKNNVCPQLTDLLEYKHVNVRVLKGSHKLIFNQLTLPFSLYKEKEVDKYIFPAFPCPILFQKKGIITLIADMVCFDCPETMKKKAQLFFRVSTDHSWKVSETIITISEFSRERILARYGTSEANDEKIILAYCGISDMFCNASPKTEKERQKIREKYQLPERYCLCLSTLEPRKNLPLLLDAYTKAAKEGVKLPPLVLAGRKGWLIDKLLERAGKEADIDVIVTGFVEDEDLPELYRMAEVFVFPSMYEGFGMPPLEALSVGTRVLSSDAASLPEVLGEDAVYFQNGNVNDLKEKLVACLTDETKSQNHTVNPKFDWKESAKVLRERL